MKKIVLSPLFNVDSISKAKERGKELLEAITTEMVIKAIEELWPKVMEI
jgi:hypothetical protein